MSTSTTKQQSHPMVMLATMFTGAFVAAYNENIMNMALIDLMAELSVDSITAQWLVSGYMVVSTLMVAVSSFLFRRFHMRPLFLTALGILAVGSAVGFVAPSFATLMLARLIQAIGTGMLIPLMMNAVLLVAPRERVGSMLAIGSAMITFGPAIAPVLSGVVVSALGWRFVFIPTLVIALATLIGGLIWVHSINESQRVRIDALSVALAALVLFSLVWGMSVLATNPLLALVGIACCIACVIWFSKRQVRLARDGREPLLDLGPMRSVRFWPACLLSMIAMMCTFSMSVLLPLYFQGSLGASALAAGFMLLIPVLVNVVMAPIAGRIEDTHGEWPLLPIGFAVVALGFAVLTFASPSLTLPTVIAGAILVFGGVGTVMSPSQTAGLKTLAPEQNPSGVSLVNVFVQTAACVAPSLYIGLMSGVETAHTAELGAAAATAAGFSYAALVACIIAIVGALLAAGYARTLRRR